MRHISTPLCSLALGVGGIGIIAGCVNGEADCGTPFGQHSSCTIPTGAESAAAGGPVKCSKADGNLIPKLDSGCAVSCR